MDTKTTTIAISRRDLKNLKHAVRWTLNDYQNGKLPLDNSELDSFKRLQVVISNALKGE